MAVIYRRAQMADIARIAKIHGDSWRRTYRGTYADEFLDGELAANRHEVWEARLGALRRGQLVLVAENAKEITGFICVFGEEDATWGALIDNLHVCHDAKGGGIGTALLREAATWVRDQYPGSGLFLWVLQSNVYAQDFYKRRGAVNRGVIDKDIPGGGSAKTLRYVWPTSQAMIAECQRREFAKATSAV